jgi:hypothetical protein
VVDEVRSRGSAGPSEVLVVAPVLSRSRLGHWLSADTHRRRRQAEERLTRSVEAMRAAGLTARGEIGDADPLQAIDDAIRTFRPDEIVISTHPPDRSTWLERRVVQHARVRFTLPITHVIVDLAADGETTVDAPPPPRDLSGRERILLFHAAPYDEAMRIRERGFHDLHDTPGSQTAGVLLTERPPDGDDGDAPLVFGVRIPQEVVGRFEATPPGERGRRFVVPAGLVNGLGPPELVSDDMSE